MRNRKQAESQAGAAAMKQEERIRRLLATFVEELDGRVRAMSNDLALLEQATSNAVRTEVIDSLLRTTHSLKGAAQSVRIEELDLACHLVEEILIGLKAPSASSDQRTDRLTLLRSTTDAFAEAAKRLRTAGDLEESRLTDLLPHLETAAHEVKAVAPDQPSTNGAVSIRAPSSDGVASRGARSTPSEVLRPARTNHFEEIRWQLEQLIVELTTETGKEIDFEISERGSAALLVAEAIDSSIAERLGDPLLHLVRNAIDHGIESAAERAAAAKPRRGKIELQARVADAQLEVSVRDDGRGLDHAALAASAERSGRPIPDTAEEVEALVYLTGLSTSGTVTRRSGRGIGLDAVRARLESLGGSVRHRSIPGQGTTFTLSVPLDGATVAALVVSAGGRHLALPGVHKDDVRQVEKSDLRWILGRPVAILEGELLAIAPLDLLLETSAWLADLSSGDRGSTSLSGKAVILRRHQQSVLIAVDKVGAVEELKLQPLGHRLMHIPCIAGAALAKGNELTLVLETADLAQRVLDPRPGTGIDTAGGPDTTDRIPEQ